MKSIANVEEGHMRLACGPLIPSNRAIGTVTRLTKKLYPLTSDDVGDAPFDLQDGVTLTIGLPAVGAATAQEGDDEGSFPLAPLTIVNASGSTTAANGAAKPVATIPQ